MSSTGSSKLFSFSSAGNNSDFLLPTSINDVHYDNAKFRNRSFSQFVNQTFVTSGIKRCGVNCSISKWLALLMVVGLMIIIGTHKTPIHPVNDVSNDEHGRYSEEIDINSSRFGNRRLPPRLTPDKINRSITTILDPEWGLKQQKVKQAFIHAWTGYKTYAMGYDELMPLAKRGVDGLGGLGATVVDSLDTAIIMGAHTVVSEAGSWIETNLLERIDKKGQVNLFETTIRVLGGLLSAYHLSGGEKAGGTDLSTLVSFPNPEVYLKTAQELADRLLLAFTSSPTHIPYSDVVLRDRSAHPAPDGLSSTSEVSSVQLEFSYLSQLSGDSKYGIESMKVLEHFRELPKTEGLVPIYISPQSGQFNGENIRLGSRGDSYYEYLLKIWLQQKEKRDTNLKYLRDMYEEAMKGVKHLLVRKSYPKGLIFVGELPYGPNGGFSPKMDHLVCFLPGVLALGATKGVTKKKALEDNLLTTEDMENLKLAEDLAKTCFEIYNATSTGLASEIVYFSTQGNSERGPDGVNQNSDYAKDIVIKPADRHNLLRPEAVESLFVLYRITQDPIYRQWGWQIFKAFEKYTKVDSGGYSSLNDVTVVPPPKRDKMETFFLGETLKYLYLLFGESDVLPLDKFVFNTEAHPFPIKG